MVHIMHPSIINFHSYHHMNKQSNLQFVTTTNATDHITECYL